MENRKEEHKPIIPEKQKDDTQNEAKEIKNAHAVGLGAMGRSDEALPDKPEEPTKVEPGDY